VVASLPEVRVHIIDWMTLYSRLSQKSVPAAVLKELKASRIPSHSDFCTLTVGCAVFLCFSRVSLRLAS